MPNEKWKHIQWKRDGSDNALIREFLADSNNIKNCDQCPYKMKHLKNDNFNGGGTEAIIKPVQDTSSGVGVEKIKGIEAIKNNLQEKAANKGTYIVQECY